MREHSGDVGNAPEPGNGAGSQLYERKEPRCQVHRLKSIKSVPTRRFRHISPDFSRYSRFLTVDDLIAQQISYYRARAAEYDEWFLRQGRYDRGPKINRQWFTEVEEVRRALDAFAPKGDVLELAGGTGLWTEQLNRYADRVTVVDSSPEMLALNRGRLNSDWVRYIQHDLFTWLPDDQYDAVFFGFWLSHVPPERFATFWRLVRDALRPAGRVFFVDSRYDESSTAVDHELEGPDSAAVTRRLNDGREYRIVKRFYRPSSLEQDLSHLDWHVMVKTTPTYFLYGFGSPQGRQDRSESS
jgi:SAM-dependent methyltransferase